MSRETPSAGSPTKSIRDRPTARLRKLPPAGAPARVRAMNSGPDEPAPMSDAERAAEIGAPFELDPEAELDFDERSASSID